MAEAPRFKAYFKHADDRPVVHMSRVNWDSFDFSSTGTVILDIEKTPLSSVAQEATVVVAYANHFTEASVEVGVVRLDYDDDPEIYNIDKYTAWIDMPSHPEFESIVDAASTEDNQNLRDYLAGTVFFVKREPDKDHHRAELWQSLKILIDDSE